MKKHSFLFLIPTAILFLLLTAQNIYGAVDQINPVLTDINFMVITPEHEQITFLLDSSSTVRIFTFNGERPRIILDFPKTIPALTVANTIKTNGNLVERIRMGIHKGDRAKTRIVLDLALDMEIAYKQTMDKDKNLLTLSVYKAGSEPELPQVEIIPPEPIQLIPESQDKRTEKERKDEEEAEKTVEPTVPVESVEPEEYTKPVEIKASTAPALHSISFVNSTGKGEMIQFQLNGFYPPEISTIEKEMPRVILDFQDTTLASHIPNIITTDSQVIKSIRVGKHNNPDKIRVVIDLVPDNSYDLKQIFFKEDNLFVVIVDSTGK